jgi:hypothetical protein
MLNRKGKKSQKKEVLPERINVAEEVLPEEIHTLKARLGEALLLIELQDNMLTIASKELGVDLRKKHVTRQSK